MKKAGLSSMNPPGTNIPLYKMVRNHILKVIDDGGFEKDHRLPSELELVASLGVSRMTVNRALRELATEGYVERIAGVGTFAVERKAQSHPLEIHSISKEIANRGHIHKGEVISLGESRATQVEAMLFSLTPGSRLFHSVVLHRESGIPIQLEDRLILPKFAPGYLAIDFSEITPTDYLMSVDSAIEEVEQIVQATMPGKYVQEILNIGNREPCLSLFRRTWVRGEVVSRVVMHHPAERFQFGGRYQP